MADPSSMQMPAAPNSGPAPAPYAGPELQPEPPEYHADIGPLADAAGDVMSGVTGLGTPESAVAHDVNAGPPDAPYYPGPLVPIYAAGDDDAGGRDTVASTIAGAVANATGRWQEFQSDITGGQGGTYGDLMHFPASPLDPGAGVGNTLPTAGFYDPPREYGGAQGAPGYEGEAQ